jgi:hypothetical protein
MLQNATNSHIYSMICIIYSPWYWWNMVKVSMIRGFLMSVSLPSCHQYAPVLSPRKAAVFSGALRGWRLGSPPNHGGYPNKSLDGLFHGKSQSKMDDWIVIPFYEGSILRNLHIYPISNRGHASQFSNGRLSCEKWHVFPFSTSKIRGHLWANLGKPMYCKE